jgi:hypothetical protein
MSLSRVDFPPPFGPMIAKKSSSFIIKFIFSKTSVLIGNPK